MVDDSERKKRVVWMINKRLDVIFIVTALSHRTMTCVARTKRILSGGKLEGA